MLRANSYAHFPNPTESSRVVVWRNISFPWLGVVALSLRNFASSGVNFSSLLCHVSHLHLQLTSLSLGPCIVLLIPCSSLFPYSCFLFSSSFLH